jgi:hypothetical protein
MEGFCDWCQVESATLVPVVNRDATIPFEFVFVCPSCKEVEQFEHADELLWSPVNFVDLIDGRLQAFAA